MDYELIRARKKNLSLTVDQEGRVIVRAPLRMSGAVIDDFVRRHEDWIAAKRAMVMASPKYGLCDREKESLRQKAKEYLPGRTMYFAQLMGVKPEKIGITSAQKRFGSCNSKGHINFSLYLMAYPEAAIDYVIVHELAHLKELNHSKDFYRIIESVLPDYKEREKLLK